MTSFSSRIIGAVGIASGALFLLADSASAFSFTNTVSGTDPKQDIFLESVLFEDGEFVDDFILVSAVDIIANDVFTGGSSGGASADKGDEATTGVAVQNPSAADLLANMGNLNLNNIIDTEEKGSFTIDLAFSSAIDNLLIWERGGNSRLSVQPIADDGTLLGTARVVNSAFWDEAGFSIDTTEVSKAQPVSSEGFKVADFFGVSQPVSKFRFISESSFQGPDFKVVGTKAASVPEPGMMMGLGIVGGALFLKRYRRA